MRNAIIIIIILTLFYHCSIRNHNDQFEYIDNVEFKTGQILLGRFDYWNTGRYVQFCTLNLIPYLANFGYETHIGIIVVFDKPYVYQMGNSIQYNYKTGKYERFRDYLMDVNDYYKKYNGNIYIIDNPDITEEMQKTITENVQNTPYRPFTNHPVDFINTVAGIESLRGNKYICTRLVQELLPIKWSKPAGLETLNEMKADLKEAGWTNQYQLKNVFTEEVIKKN